MQTDHVDEDLDDGPEQYSDASRQALADALQNLIEGLQEHGAKLAALPGGSRSTHAVFTANDTVTTLVTAWAAAVSDHTGTNAIPLRVDDDEDDEDWDDDPPEPVEGATISVVERWDLVVTDSQALLEAGRQAHVRTWDEETPEDAVVAVNSPAFALYTVAHEAGPTWLDVPGTHLLSGTRHFIRSEEAASDPAEPGTEIDQVSPPAGDVLFVETWA